MRQSSLQSCLVAMWKGKKLLLLTDSKIVNDIMKNHFEDIVDVQLHHRWKAMMLRGLEELGCSDRDFVSPFKDPEGSRR